MLVSGAAQQELLDAFREHYHRYEVSVQEAVRNSLDTVVLWRLGDDLEQYSGLLGEYSFIFEPAELELIQQNVAVMQSDVRQQYANAVDESHEGHPMVMETAHTGSVGRPSIEIDPDFLRWAYSLRSTASITCFLGVSRSVVRRALLQHGIALPQEQPAGLAYRYTDDAEDEEDYPIIPPEEATPAIASYTGPLSTITDNDLDELLIWLRQHFRRAGLTMFQGILITGLLASNNNRAQTVLDLFLMA
ncbi:hypothetical protein K438DRAFT_1687456, partial [Mycena galopus ATCC 62051]